MENKKFCVVDKQIRMEIAVCNFRKKVDKRKLRILNQLSMPLYVVSTVLVPTEIGCERKKNRDNCPINTNLKLQIKHFI